MKRFIKLFCVCLFSLLNAVNANAQDESSMNLHFVYIAHEVTTPVTELCRKIQSLQEDAMEVDDALIVYLSDGRTSLSSFTNLQDVSGKGRDKQEAFVEIVAALEDANSHDVIAADDVNNIINLFDEFNFIKPDGSFRYNSVTFDFYVGNSFWALNNNEKVIAHLYHDFNVASMPKGVFAFNIYKPKTDHIQYKEGMLFGDNNLEGINDKVKVFEY